MKTALVAGAAGFLGSNLCSKLLTRGLNVVGLDNLATGNNRNLEKLSQQKGFSFINQSVTERLPLGKIEKLDYVFHLASPASPPKYHSLPFETISANTIGTLTLMETAMETAARFIFASTSEVYGDPLVSPQPETYLGNVNPIGPRGVYDEAKRLGETMVSQLVREEKIDAGIIRIFNTYGPGMDPFDGRVVSTFIRQAIRQEPLTIFGDGSQTRSFCFVDDLIEGIVLMAESKVFGPVNLGNPREISLLGLGRIISETLNLEVTFEHLPLPEDDPKQRNPDISRARSLLGWQPLTSLEDGIARTAIWMQTYGGIT
jgi:dTDP-glucose 4,6-dehydratase